MIDKTNRPVAMPPALIAPARYGLLSMPPPVGFRQHSFQQPTQQGCNQVLGKRGPATVIMTGTKACIFSGQRPHGYRPGVRSSDGSAARYRSRTGSSPIIPKHERA